MTATHCAKPLRRTAPSDRPGRLRGGLLGMALALHLGAASAQQPAASVACPPQAQPVSAGQAQVGMQDARDHGFLWRITREGRVSYLYGTVHVARPQWMFPGPQTARALAASDMLALELDMLDSDIQRRLAAGMATDLERVPDALALRLRTQWQAACLPLEALAQLAPTMQLAALTTLAARWDGLDPAYAVDSFLAAYARAAGKSVVSLETPELQLALLRGDPQTAPERLEQGLAQLERGQVRPMLVRISQVWADGRDDELSRYAQWCDCAETDADRAALKRLLDERNPPLAERIDALHAAGRRVFAAIGALHMVGTVGLPALLAQRGFKVQRVSFEP